MWAQLMSVPLVTLVVLSGCSALTDATERPRQRRRRRVAPGVVGHESLHRNPVRPPDGSHHGTGVQGQRRGRRAVRLVRRDVRQEYVTYGEPVSVEVPRMVRDEATRADDDAGGFLALSGRS